MNDGVCGEPIIWHRPWVSGAAYLQGMTQIPGNENPHRDKEAIEGGFQDKPTGWGLEYDTAPPLERTPEQSVLKGAPFFADGAHDHGNKDIYWTYRKLRTWVSHGHPFTPADGRSFA